VDSLTGGVSSLPVEGWVGLLGIGLLSMLVSPGLKPRSDQELVEAFQAHGDQRLLTLLLSRHRELIRGNLRRYRVDLAPEDFEQELYLMLYEKLPRAGEVLNFRAWLGTMVRNRLCDMLRRQGSRQHYESYCQLLPQSYEPSPEHRMDREALIGAAFAAVNDKEASCLRARYLGEQSYEEVAQELNLSIKQVCGRLERGMKKMRDQIC
jgi:RNA polymerase sigma-70 factor (ECF subfamily)